MIYDPDFRVELDRSALVGHVVNEIVAVCENEPGLDSPDLHEIAQGVAAYLETEARGAWVPSDFILLVTSRALRAAGKTVLADRMLQSNSEQSRLPETTLYFLAHGAVPLASWGIFCTHLIRSASWEIAGGRPLWILDLKKVHVEAGDCLELTLFRSLGVVVDAMGAVWDESSGGGVLGLRFVRQVAAEILGGSGNANAVNALVNEIRTLCAGKLDSLQVDRGWMHVPDLITLDGR